MCPTPKATLVFQLRALDFSFDAWLHGGRYVPETLMHPLQELEAEYFRAQHDPEFQRELSYDLTEFVGRPSPLYFAERLTKNSAARKFISSART